MQYTEGVNRQIPRTATQVFMSDLCRTIRLFVHFSMQISAACQSTITPHYLHPSHTRRYIRLKPTLCVIVYSIMVRENIRACPPTCEWFRGCPNPVLVY